MGIGISKDMPSQMRNVILVKPTNTESKAKELISSAFNYGIKSGLSAVLFKIESTFLLPGDAIISSSLATEASLSTDVKPEEATNTIEAEESTIDINVNDETKAFDKSETSGINGNESDNSLKVYSKRKALMWNILVPVITLVVVALITFGVVYLIAKNNGMFDKVKTEEIDYEHLYFSIDDDVPVYGSPDNSLEPIDFLYKNQAVRDIGVDGCDKKYS